ncbi:MAG TPA: PQQ-binding-like beta-propeller repeat protein, partial [Patescibacteria group bacterium]|nr:PQQ-binding-like beta-propeller repeat protein [Patescibacteria group bacterium]
TPTAPSRASDWPQWRGPHRDGVATDAHGPEVWPSKLTKVWSVPVGEGHSNPVVAGERIYLHSREADQEVVRALRLSDGGAEWKESWPVAYEMHPAAQAHGKGPRSTPVISSGTLYTLGVTGSINAIDLANGKTRWRRDFTGEFKTTSPAFGTSSSPLVDRGLVIAYVGGDHDGALVALDEKSGQTRWSYKADGPGYASPIVADLAGSRQIITQSEQSIVGVAAETGRELWKLPLTTPYEQNVVTPLLFEDLVIVSGLEYGLRAYRLERKDNTLTPREVWNRPEVSLYMSSPVIDAGRLFGFSHMRKGHFFCLDPKTGRILWQTTGREGENVALVALGDAVLALNDAAELVVIPAGGATFAPLARYTVADSPTWSHPVPTAGGLLIKDRQNLTLWSWLPKNIGPAGSYDRHRRTSEPQAGR